MGKGLPAGARRASKSDPCPLCEGTDSFCWRSADASIAWCKCPGHRLPDPFVAPADGRSVDREHPISTRLGTYYPVAHKSDGASGRTFIHEAELERRDAENLQAAADPVKRREMRERQEREKAERDRIDAEKLAKSRGEARAIWARCEGRDTSRLRDYLASRGIRIPDYAGMPASLRYEPSLRMPGLDRNYPGMVAAVTRPESADRPGLATVHRTYLDPNGAGKASDDREVAEAIDQGVEFVGDRLIKGGQDGGAVTLGRYGSNPVLVIGEGIETTIAAMLAVRCWGWAALNRAGLVKLELPGAELERLGVERVIVCGDLDRSGDGQRDARTAAEKISRNHPEIVVCLAIPGPASVMELVEIVDGVAMPRDGQKSVDWLDVHAMLGGDPKKVEEAIFASLERIEQPAVDRVAVVGSIGGGRDGSGSGGSGHDGESGGGDGWRRVIPEQWLNTARLAMVELFTGDDGALTLRHVSRHVEDDGQWEIWAAGLWRRVSDLELRGRVREWLGTFGKWTGRARDGVEEGGQLVPYKPEKRHLAELVDAMADLCGVNLHESELAWFEREKTGRDGLGIRVGSRYRMLDRAAWEREELPDPARVVHLRSRLIDVDAILRGELVTMTPTARLYSSPPLAFDLPFDNVREALEQDGLSGLEVFARSLAPAWVEHLQRVSNGDPAFAASLHRFIGLSMVGDTRCEKVALLVGQPGAGKGSTMAPWLRILGSTGVVSLSFDAVVERFGMESILGKRLAYFPDAQRGRWTDGGVVAETLKKLRGGDPVRVERKHRSAIPEYRPRSIVVISSNEVPELPDPGGALQSSLVIFPFADGVRGTEAEDPKYKQRLLDEAPGVMLLALVELARLYEDAEARRPVFPTTRVGASMVEQFAERSDPVGVFCRDYLEMGELDDEMPEKGDWLPTSAIVEAWGWLCEEQGEDASRWPAQRLLNKMRSTFVGMVQVGPTTHVPTGKRCRGWAPLRFKADAYRELKAEHAERAGANAQGYESQSGIPFN